MNLNHAYGLLQQLLLPLPLDRFLDDVMGNGAVRVGGSPDHFRTTLLGDDPSALILGDFDRLSEEMTCHGEGATAPPPEKSPTADADAFHALIGAYHARGYTVRLPSLRGVAPMLDQVMRALECALHQPVEDAVFWSRGGGLAPVHYDEQDIIVVQLSGRKRWHISAETSELNNKWRNIPGPAPSLGRHNSLEVGPGDLLYLPRGTLHAVEALSDSIHVSIAFVPLTVREAMIAALDHLSDLDRDLRIGVGNRLAEGVRASQFGDTPRRVADGLQKLLQAVSSPGFVEQALQRRSSRIVRDLAKLPATKEAPELSLETKLRHAPLAICHLSANAEKIDFSQPGDHIYIHRGAERSVMFMAETPEFRVRDLPGDVGDDVRLALAAKFVKSGFLQIDE